MTMGVGAVAGPSTELGVTLGEPVGRIVSLTRSYPSGSRADSFRRVHDRLAVPAIRSMVAPPGGGRNGDRRGAVLGQ